MTAMESLWQHVEKMAANDKQRIDQFQKEDALAISQMETRISELESLLSGVYVQVAMLQTENKELKGRLDSLAAAVVSSAQLSKYAERNSQPSIENAPKPISSVWSQNNFGSHSSLTDKSNLASTILPDTTIPSFGQDSSRSGNRRQFVFHSDVAVRTQLETWCASQTPQLKLVLLTSSSGQSPYQTFCAKAVVSDVKTTENKWQAEGVGKTKRDAEASACKHLILSNFTVTHHPPSLNK